MANNVALGINTNFGYAEESTYGTRVAPTNFLNITTEGLKLSQAFNPITVLGKPHNADYVNGKRSVDGSFELPGTYDKSTGVFLKHAMGSVASTSLGGGAYSHVITPSGVLPVGLSLYVDRDSSTVGTAYAYQGCQISDLKLTLDAEQPLKVAVTVNGQDETEVAYSGATIAAPKYIYWDQTFTANMTASGVAVSGVQIHAFSFEVKTPLNENRYSLGQRTKTGQGIGGVRTINGSMTIEFSDKTHYGYFRNGIEISGNFAMTGPAISGSNSYGIAIDIPRMKLDGNTPNVGGEGEITMELPFTAYYDSGTSKLCSITLTNTNSSIS